MNSQFEITFKSKKDTLFTIIIFTILLLIVFIAIDIITKMSSLLHIIPLLIILSVATLISWLFIRTYYIITHDTFYYFYGPFKGQIKLSSITKIKVNTTLWVGLKPATSMNGIIIYYNKFDDIYISPKDNDLFVKTLIKVQPNIIIS